MLSVEDIIVSKIIRLAEKDLEDIDILINMANKELINEIICEVLSRNDLYKSKKEQFEIQLVQFRERYNV